MSKPNAFRLAVLVVFVAAAFAAGFFALSPNWGEPDEYRTVLISGCLTGTTFGEWEDTVARDTPNVALVLNQLRAEGWRIDRMLYLGQSVLVVAAR